MMPSESGKTMADTDEATFSYISSWFLQTPGQALLQAALNAAGARRAKYSANVAPAPEVLKRKKESVAKEGTLSYLNRWEKNTKYLLELP